jgi:hypothetical protein
MGSLDALNFVELAVIPSLVGAYVSFRILVGERSRIALRLMLLLSLQIPLTAVIVTKPVYVESMHRVVPFSYSQIGEAMLYFAPFLLVSQLVSNWVHK